MKRPQLKMPKLKKPQIPGPQLKKPQFRGPKLKMPQFSRPRIGGPQIQAPQFLDDLYRDLRDRRLLPVVAMLLVAIVAVPIALSLSSSGSQFPVDSTAALPADAPEAQAAVLAENPVLRDYKQRLDALKAKNPFDQQFQTTNIEKTEVQDTSASTAGVDSGGAAPADIGGGDVSTGTTSTDTAPSAPPDTAAQPADAGVEKKFFAFRVDVFYGLDGDVKQVNNVKPLDGLSPVGLFVGATEDAKRAVFMLSSDVVGVPGEGTCAPSPDNCEFLGLKEGEAVEILYQPAEAPAAAVYRLRLEQIKLVPVKNSPFSVEE
jgi:hypothetical protein